MSYRKSFLILIYLALLSPLAAQQAEEWLQRSIQYHDPDGVWGTAALQFDLSETRPDGPDRKTLLRIGPGGGDFYWDTRRDGHRLEGELTDSGCLLRLDGSEDISDEDRETFRLTCDRLRFMRNYYVYLWGLPMKLRDPGTRLDPQVERIELDGRPVVSLRVTYEAEVGEDIWYFYLDPETAALVAYRFYHDEAKGDGEIIELEGEVVAVGMRLPKARTWITNLDGRLLGTDTLVELSTAGGAQ